MNDSRGIEAKRNILGVTRDILWGGEKRNFYLKVPRQCLLVFLVRIE
jgi:hypothetical protein